MIISFTRDQKIASRIADLLSSVVSVSETVPQVIREAERSSGVSAVVVGEDVAIAEATDLAGELRATDPTIAIILLRTRVDLGATTDAMRAGIRSVLSSSDIQGLIEQVAQQEQVAQAIRAKIEGRSLEGKRGTVVLVYSAKGGVGKTTTSLNLAACLTHKSEDTAVVLDLDLQFGDVGVATGLADETRSIADLGSDPAAISQAVIEKSICQVENGFDVLLAPATPAEAEKVNADIVSRTIEQLVALYDWVVVDSPPAFTDEILAAFDHADVQVMVSTPDLPSVKNLSVATTTLKRIGLDKTARCVVINRFDSRAGMDRSELTGAAATIAETKNVIVLPDQPLVLKSSSLGYVAALGPKGDKVRKMYRELVQFVSKVSPVEAAR